MHIHWQQTSLQTLYSCCRREGAGSSSALDRRGSLPGAGGGSGRLSPQPSPGPSPALRPVELPPGRPGSALGGRASQSLAGGGFVSPPPRPASALGRPPRSAAEVAAAELTDFRAAMEAKDLDYDPAAPAAMKASPSGSEGVQLESLSSICGDHVTFATILWTWAREWRRPP